MAVRLCQFQEARPAWSPGCAWGSPGPRSRAGLRPGPQKAARLSPGAYPPAPVNITVFEPQASAAGGSSRGSSR